MAKIAKCQNCGKEFKVFECWIKKGAGKNCSRSCARKGKPSYIRTPEHRKKMSSIIKSNPCIEKARNHFKKLNHNKKGKTWEEIYGKEKAKELRKLYKKLTSGKNNGNFIDGRSFLPYSYTFTKLLKEKIIKRDGFTCKGCSVSHQELVDKDPFKRGLTIHHVDYDKTNSLESNLIALCRVCNSKANSNRQYYQQYYGQQT